MVPTRPSYPALKTILPEIADFLGVTVDQIYARQRELVTAGVLKAVPGRGPGSGVPATPQNVATILIALLVDTRGTTAARTQKLANARPAAPTRFTQDLKFVDAIARILSGREFEEEPIASTWWPLKLSVSRDTLEASIDWAYVKNGSVTSAEYSVTGRLGPPRRLKIIAEMSGGIFTQIRIALWAASRKSNEGRSK